MDILHKSPTSYSSYFESQPILTDRERRERFIIPTYTDDMHICVRCIMNLPNTDSFIKYSWVTLGKIWTISVHILWALSRTSATVEVRQVYTDRYIAYSGVSFQQYQHSCFLKYNCWCYRQVVFWLRCRLRLLWRAGILGRLFPLIITLNGLNFAIFITMFCHSCKFVYVLFFFAVSCEFMDTSVCSDIIFLNFSVLIKMHCFMKSHWARRTGLLDFPSCIQNTYYVKVFKKALMSI